MMARLAAKGRGAFSSLFVRRPPRFAPQGKSIMLEVTPTLHIPDTEFAWSYARSGGPGGQNVNKVATKAVLRWDVTRSPSVPPAVKERFIANNQGRITTEGVVVVMSERTR